MEEQASQVTMDFAAQLIALSRVIVDIFKTNDLDRLPEMNRIIKEMYRLQHDSEDPAMQTIDVEANVIYTNFDMLVKVLKTAETDGDLPSLQNAVNKFLHNINEATVNIAQYGVALTHSSVTYVLVSSLRRLRALLVLLASPTPNLALYGRWRDLTQNYGVTMGVSVHSASCLQL